MERLTMRDVGGMAFWISPQSPGGGYRLSEDKEDQRRLDRLAAYEDTGLEPEDIDALRKREQGLAELLVQVSCGCAVSYTRLTELAQAEKDGRLVVLPCKDDIVYTIKKNYFNCTECKHGGSAHYQAKIDRVSCDMDDSVHCPLYVEEHRVDGFEVSFDASGSVVLSSPGEFGYEGLETFGGIDGKVYYTREEAEAALKKREEAGNEKSDSNRL